MVKVYICSPLRGDYYSNQRKAEKYCRAAVMLGFFPVAPHIYLTRFMDDDNLKERKQALEIGLSLIEECEAMWVFIPDGETPSEGMQREIDRAKQRGMFIAYFSVETALDLIAQERFADISRIIEKQAAYREEEKQNEQN